MVPRPTRAPPPGLAAPPQTQRVLLRRLPSLTTTPTTGLQAQDAEQGRPVPGADTQVKRGRGGHRPGAGAKKGNLNALRHGRYSIDPDLKSILAHIPADIRRDLLPYIRASSRTIKRRLAWLRPAPTYADPKIVPFRQAPTATTSTHAEQSNIRSEGQDQAVAGPLRALALRLASHGFMGAEAFIRAHSPAAPVIEHIVDELEAFDDDTYSRIKNPGGLLRNSIHEEIAEYSGPTPYCPYCRWRSQQEGLKAQ